MKIFLVEIEAYDPELDEVRTLRYSTAEYNEVPASDPPVAVLYFEEYDSGAWRLTNIEADADGYPQAAAGKITIDDDATGAASLFTSFGRIRILEA